MKYLLLILLLSLISCKEKAKDTNPDRSALHGVWESVSIRTKEPGPPKLVTIEITAYNKTKLTYLKMTAYGENNQSFEKTIRVSLDEKGYIIPSIAKEMVEWPDRFIWHNPKGKSAKIQKAYKHEVQQLKWRYYLSGKQLTIEMGTSRMILSKKD